MVSLVDHTLSGPRVIRTIITLSLLAQPREEGLASRKSVKCHVLLEGTCHTSRAVRDRSQVSQVYLFIVKRPVVKRAVKRWDHSSHVC